MLSRLSLRGSQGVAKCFTKFIPCAAVNTSSSSPAAEPCVRKSEVEGVGKRDLVNFPDRTLNEYPPPTRFLFIPEAFFKSLYPKTGVTGPYMFFFAGGTYLLSKEIVPIEHHFVMLMSWSILIFLVNYKFGDKIGEAWNKNVQQVIDVFDKPQELEKMKLREEIKQLEESKGIKEIVTEIMKAKRENVHLQLEAAYRCRMAEVYKRVKNRLDCQVELEYADRRIAQKNLIDYVLRNVMKSITPEQEASTLQNCIANLNALAAKA